MIIPTLVQMIGTYRGYHGLRYRFKYILNRRVYSMDILDSRYNHNEYNNILIGGYNKAIYIP